MQPAITVVVPMYQSETTVADTIRSLLRQTLRGVEIVVVDDGSTDRGPAIAEEFVRSNPAAVRLVRQANRGLAGARNSGIRAARAAVVGFCDADDLWAPTKASEHAFLLSCRPSAGLTFAGSVVVDADLIPTGNIQIPDGKPLRLESLICDNPLGNGSTAVLRRECLDAVAFDAVVDGETRRCWFDETLRRSEDVDLWMRILMQGRWQALGIPAALTAYRVRMDGLSSDADGQMETWLAVFGKLRAQDPEFAARWGALAEAYQWRWQARKAVFAGDGGAALGHVRRMLFRSPGILLHSPAKTAVTVAGAVAALCFGRSPTAVKSAMATARGQQPLDWGAVR